VGLSLKSITYLAADKVATFPVAVALGEKGLALGVTVVYSVTVTTTVVRSLLTVGVGVAVAGQMNVRTVLVASRLTVPVQNLGMQDMQEAPQLFLVPSPIVTSERPTALE
jgi:hypothetical protein